MTTKPHLPSRKRHRETFVWSNERGEKMEERYSQFKYIVQVGEEGSEQDAYLWRKQANQVEKERGKCVFEEKIVRLS